ncbi:hypothetical protein Tcan_01989 [Toxocara canis]|uniref:Uncharacterized protein n=1 Tax=Toxocara canis TaxID=6265 RepID=A0A0B2VBY9_TOXCA|nr:hypothetical protein Tcan_01989 [Toxocara canis]
MPSQNASPIPPQSTQQITQAPPPYTRPALMNAPIASGAPTQFHVTSSTHMVAVDHEKAETSSVGFQQSSQPTPKEQYRLLKKRFKFLVYKEGRDGGGGIRYQRSSPLVLISVARVSK